MSKSSRLADLIADLDSTAPKDYDPEDILEPVNDNQGESDSEADDNDDSTARDHYVSVGKSKLRSEQPLLDDPRYAGQRTSRKDIYSDNDEGSDDDDEFDDDEDLLATAQAKFANGEVDEEESSEEESSEDEEIGSGDEQVDDDDEEEEEASDNEEEEEASENEEDDEINAELRKIQEEEKQMISQLSKSAQSDVEKGKHVRQQLKMWDNCLESRIRMQKVIDDANKLPQKDTYYDFLANAEGIETELETAKTDLREIIDDLMDMRVGLFAQNGSIDLSDKDYSSRKRHLDDDDEYLEKLWNDMSEINDVFVPFRNSTLEKWSNKVQAAAGAKLNKKFKAFDQNIMTQIDNVLGDQDSLLKRTQLQRSDYKILGKVNVTLEEKQEQEEIDSGKKPDRHLNNYDVEIFDDQDFYQQQLRELIESRMVDTDDPLAIGMRWAARKQNEQKKKKKVVDRKASKGRQLRFNVHEKLQNFMAPIPVGDWHDTMVEELYTSLLGQRLGGESLVE